MMKLDANGLPLPGRELDAWVAIEIMGWTDLMLRHAEDDWTGVSPGQITDGFAPSRFEVPQYSTTNAFFLVMEAQPPNIEFVIYTSENGCIVTMRDLDRLGKVLAVAGSHGKTQEQNVAHAVCAVLWKARQDV